MRSSQIFLAVVCVVLLALPTPALAARSPVVVIDGPRLRLSDLLGPVVSDIDLGPAPQPGSLRQVPRGRVAGYITRRRARRLPAFFRVRTRSQRLDCKTLQRRVSAALSASLASGLRVKNVTCRTAIDLPAGRIQLRARLVGRRRAGRLFAHLSLSAGRWPTKQLVVPVEVDGMLSVLIARRDLVARRPIAPGDVRIEKRRASTLAADVLTTTRGLSEWEPRGVLRAGTMLRRGRLQQVPLVRRGARVTVTVNLPGLRVTSSGQVRQNGGRGQTITVLCLKSRKLMRARVVSRRRVVVDL